jgi:hypothetical protein
VKICWDNLENLIYKPKLNKWKEKNRKRYYIFKEKCKNCNEPFLALDFNIGNYCSKKCNQTGKHNSYYNKKTMYRETHPNWKGGISCEPYCIQWLDKEYKESIKKRDKYMCLNPACNKINKILTIHHINYNKKDCRPKNLITLCKSCNSIANFNRKWHKSWYTTIIINRGD